MPNLRASDQNPRPCYESLKNNVPTPLVQITDQTWPLGTENFVSHTVINQYIRAAAKLSHLSEFTQFNTSVETLWKPGDRWMLTSRKLIRSKTNKLMFSTQTQASTPGLGPAYLIALQAFDAVIVASGHYHTMRIPDIPGLKEWKSTWPARVHHSKGYRRPSDYKNQVWIRTSSAHIRLVVLASDTSVECTLDWCRYLFF